MSLEEQAAPAEEPSTGGTGNSGMSLVELHNSTEDAYNRRKSMLHFMFSLEESAKLHIAEGLMDIAALLYYR